MAIETKSLLYKSIFDLLSVHGPCLLSNPALPLEVSPALYVCQAGMKLSRPLPVAIGDGQLSR